MSTDDLDLILRKDPIISTFPASQLRARPEVVEQNYSTHAKTHLSLGDTEKHVDTIFKWVSGQNKGAFIGAVEGNYGEGKTSFLVHVWSRSVERKVFTVPPFQWTSLADVVDAVGAWLAYILGRTHADVAKRSERLHQEFKQQSLEDVTRQTAVQTGGDYDTILAALKNREAQGARLTEVTPERLLDFCKQASELVKEAGYEGLLVLLDEPEVAAKQIGNEKVAGLLFDLSTLLLQSQGEYGIFISMPTNFLADISRRFPALTARLQARGCFPRLRDVYGPDFARVLWSRYVAEFELGEEGSHIVSDLALQGIGQVGSSARSDLSYGPRTVVSAFCRMVFRYRETGKPYEPEDFVQDCIGQEIMVALEYPTRVLEILGSPEVTEGCRGPITLLAAFPDGLRVEEARQRGVDGILRDLSRRGTLVYKTATTFGLNGLRKTDIVPVDPLRDAVLEVESGFAPIRETFEHATAAFKDRVIPLVFEPRQGQQLVGWEPLSPWSKSKSGTWVGAYVGAFLQTQKQYPKRAILVILSSVDSTLENVEIPDLPPDSGPQDYDVVFHFRLRWNVEQELGQSKLEVRIGDPEKRKFAFVGITIDLLNETAVPVPLDEWVEAETLTPFWLLNLTHEVDRQTLPKEFDAQWQALRRTMLRDIVPLFFGEDLGTLAAEQLGQPVSGSGLGFLGSLLQRVLLTRYPKYSTLICSPQWQGRVDDYIRALKSNDIPLRCKRGRETWKAEGNLAPAALGTSRMNLTGGTFEGLENLLEVASTGKNAPIEVEFHIHPLEQVIADLICSERCGPANKLKIDGKECWWMSVRDLLPMIRSSGYAVEELKKIIEIGSSRGTFNVTDRKGEQVVYCKPIDPDQMRRQLQDKLEDLQKEIAEFSRLPDFQSKFEIDALARQIAVVQDEPEYDRLVTRLNKEFEQLHQRLPGYFDRLQEVLFTIRNDVQQVAGQLASSREVGNLKTIPAAKSEWGAKLSRYIVGNLSETVQESRTQATALLKDLDAHLLKFKYQPNRIPLDNLALLVEGQSALADVSARAKELKDRTRALMVNLQDYEEWLKLLRRSDEVYESLLQLQSKVSDQAAVGSLLSDYDRFTQDISDHLEVRNVSGLGAHKQFAANLEDIDKKRQAYLGQIKTVFDSRKEAVNRFLEALKIDRRVTITFNPMSTEACYRDMFEQGVTHVKEAAIGRPLAEIEAQRRELLYARDILTSVPAEVAEPLLARLSAAQESLTELDSKVSMAWMEGVTEQDSADERTGVAQIINNALEGVRSARNAVKSATRPAIPSEGRAKLMHSLIVESGSVDLKDIILRMMSDTEDATHVLDESLQSLVELFRANCIQIRVERRRE